MLDRISTAEAINESARPFRGRRLSWAQFYVLRPDLRADNDNNAIRAEMGNSHGGNRNVQVQNIGEWKAAA